MFISTLEMGARNTVWWNTVCRDPTGEDSETTTVGLHTLPGLVAPQGIYSKGKIQCNKQDSPHLVFGGSGSIFSDYWLKRCQARAWDPLKPQTPGLAEPPWAWPWLNSKLHSVLSHSCFTPEAILQVWSMSQLGSKIHSCFVSLGNLVFFT